VIRIVRLYSLSGEIDPVFDIMGENKKKRSYYLIRISLLAIYISY